MDIEVFSKLEAIIDDSTDATEFQLVVATLISMIDTLSFDSKYDLRLVLQSLKREFNSSMTIDKARKKCKEAITAVSIALNSH